MGVAITAANGTEAHAPSQRIRERVEGSICRLKMIGGQARVRFVGRWTTKQQGEISAAGYETLRAGRSVWGV